MRHTVQTNRNTLTETAIAEAEPGGLADGAVRLSVESFAVTANNITYAVAGDRFGYWNFFPAPEGGDWGVVPMWGHARVSASNHPDIAEGERVYGYLPMGEGLDVVPGTVSAHGLTDMAEHRQPMSPIYNQYSRISADPEHDPAREAERMIFGPLFKTGFLIERFFRSENWFGAEAMVLTSASSKTALGLASVAKDRSPDVKRIGLTSPGNVDFVRDTGLYDSVMSYDEATGLPQVPSVSVDFAGNAGLLRQIHERLPDALKYSCLVGATHIEARGGGEAGDMPGPQPTLFFAPDHAVKAIKEVGPAAFGQEIATSWRQFLDDAEGTVEVEKRQGIAAARDTYLEMLGGKVDPAKGVVIEF